MGPDRTRGDGRLIDSLSLHHGLRADLEAAGEGIRSLFDGMRNLIGTTRGDGTAADDGAGTEAAGDGTQDASTPPGE